MANDAAVFEGKAVTMPSEKGPLLAEPEEVREYSVPEKLLNKLVTAAIHRKDQETVFPHRTLRGQTRPHREPQRTRPPGIGSLKRSRCEP